MLRPYEPMERATVIGHVLENTMKAPTAVLVAAQPIDLVDRERLRRAFPQVRFTFAETAEQWLAAAPDAEVIFAKSIPREALVAATRLRWVQAGTAGVDGLLRLGVRDLNVVLTNAR